MPVGTFVENILETGVSHDYEYPNVVYIDMARLKEAAGIASDDPVDAVLVSAIAHVLTSLGHVPRYIDLSLSE